MKLDWDLLSWTELKHYLDCYRSHCMSTSFDDAMTYSMHIYFSIQSLMPNRVQINCACWSITAIVVLCAEVMKMTHSLGLVNDDKSGIFTLRFANVLKTKEIKNFIKTTMISIFNNYNTNLFAIYLIPVKNKNEALALLSFNL